MIPRKTVLLIGILALTGISLWAAGQRAGSGTSSGDSSGKLFPKERGLTLLMGDHALQPIKDFALAQQAIYDKTNIRLKYDIYSGTSGEERRNMLLATNQITELWRFNNSAEVNQYAAQGMLFDFTGYIDQMPNFKKFWDTMPVLKKSMVGGKLYALQVICRNEAAFSMGPVLRTDLLKKHNLPMPQSFADLLNVLEALKKIYRDSIPWESRGGTAGLLQATAYMLGSGYSDPYYGYAGGLYYDRAADGGKGKFIYGPITQEFKTVLSFFNDAYKRGILDPDYVSGNNDKWRADLMGGRSFFYMQNTSFAADFTTTLQKTIPDATLEFIPFLSNSYGQRRAMAYAADIRPEFYGMRADIKDPEQVIKFLDWMYSKEASDITSFGKEGVTFRYDAQGEPRFIPEWANKFIKEPQPAYAAFSETGTNIINFGLWGGNTWPFQEFNKTIGNWTGAYAAYWDLVAKENGKGGALVVPNPLPPLTAADTERVKDLNMAVGTYLDQEYDKYIMGREPISNWDKVIAEAIRLGAKEIEDIYNRAEAPYK